MSPDAPDDVKSSTFGNLPASVQPLILAHEWDNMNFSEQRDWAIQQLAAISEEDTRDAERLDWIEDRLNDGFDIDLRGIGIDVDAHSSFREAIDVAKSSASPSPSAAPEPLSEFHAGSPGDDDFAAPEKDTQETPKKVDGLQYGCRACLLPNDPILHESWCSRSEVGSTNQETT